MRILVWRWHSGQALSASFFSSANWVQIKPRPRELDIGYIGKTRESERDTDTCMQTETERYIERERERRRETERNRERDYSASTLIGLGQTIGSPAIY